MDKTYAQKIAKLTERARILKILRDTGMRCQSSLDKVFTDRDNLIQEGEKCTIKS